MSVTVKKPRSKKQGRIAIVEDVLKRLKVLNVGRGQYCKVQTWNIEELDGSHGVKEEFDNIAPYCEVCAKGAMFLAYIDLWNQFRIDDLEYVAQDEDVCEPLRQYFSQEQLDLIEIAFEGEIIKDDYCDAYEWGEKFRKRHKIEKETVEEFWGPSYRYPISQADVVQRALMFSHRYKSDVDVLAGICRNIIKNDGTFIP